MIAYPLIGVAILLLFQFLKRRADQELIDELSAEAYNRTLDENEIP
jgi:hypothetical protein